MKGDKAGGTDEVQRKIWRGRGRGKQSAVGVNWGEMAPAGAGGGNR
jgi:hypothetical protein